MSVAEVLRNADRRFYQTTRSSYHWLQHEGKARSGLPFNRKLSMWRRGFFAESATIYDLGKNDPRDYLSDYQHLVRCSRINAWPGFYTHKMFLRAFLLAMGQPQAETVALIMDDRILADPFGPNRGYLSADQLMERLRQGAGGGYVVKPEDGLRGEDIFLLAYEEGRFVRRRGTALEDFHLPAFLEQARVRRRGNVPSATLIERRLEQGPFWAGLYPGSANTIRALTMWTPGEPAPFLARAVQRIGTADTAPTDNWSGGGISAPVDLASGELGPGRMHPLKGRQPKAHFTHHPDTGAAIAGAVLPGWDEIRATVLRAAASVPFNRTAGWDVLVDRAGTPVLLEANGNSDVNLLQVHGGLLTDPAIRRFYRAFDVL